MESLGLLPWIVEGLSPLGNDTASVARSYRLMAPGRRQDAPCQDVNVENVRLRYGRHQTVQDNRGAPEKRLLLHRIMLFPPGICGRRQWPSRLRPLPWRRA